MLQPAEIAVLDAWRELHRTRFPELPFDCGNTSDPGVRYCEDLRDWSNKATTPDQRRIEHYIDRFDLRDKRVLHIGIGNSGLAKRLHRRVKEIVGTTIDEPEIRVAQALGLPNYTAILHNKYSGRNEGVRGKFDIIVDNNPTSPCCCIRHLAAFFEFFSAAVADDGQIVTDRQGLRWVPDDSNPRWSFGFDDLAAVAAVAGFSALRVNRRAYVLSRSTPPAPTPLSISKHLLRLAVMLPVRVVTNGPRELARISRQTIKRALLSAAPWALPERHRPRKKR